MPKQPILRFPPITVLIVAVALGLAVAGSVVWLALKQPWLGLTLAPNPTGPGLVVNKAAGPSQAIPVGTVLVEAGNGVDSAPLETLDLTTEPDGLMGDYATYRRFLERQDRLATIQASAKVTFKNQEGSSFIVTPDPSGRPASSLPVDFWVQVTVGLVAWLVSAGVFAFRPKDASARYLLLSGAATLMFAPCAAVYTTRELALPGTLFHWINDLNFLGGSLFAASFVALLLYYPRRIAATWVGVAVVVLYLAWFLLQQVGVFESMTFARRFLVMIGVIVTFVLAALHWFRTRRDPVARAALQWFLLSWLLGSSLFALVILLPQLFGIDTSSMQGYAFLLFLLVYGGLAFGILHFRLFELGSWWWRAVMWTATVLTIVLLDVLFLSGLRLSPGLSHGLTLLICGVIWIPLRASLWHRFSNHREVRDGELFGRVMDIALLPPGAGEPDREWRELLVSVFDPMKITSENKSIKSVEIERDGLVMRLPAIRSVTGVRMEFPRGGRGLFAPRDAALAGELVKMLGHSIDSRSAYELGVAEERGRIARDMHDNIGVHLLGALHSPDAESKDSKIRDTLADLRDVINNASAERLDMDQMLAGLRVETADRLAIADIQLKWNCDADDTTDLGTQTIHALKSIIREATSNVIKHSQARHVSISISHLPGHVELIITDDGKGFDPNVKRSGNGVSNMISRVESLGGTLDIEQRDVGIRLAAHIPIDEKSH